MRVLILTAFEYSRDPFELAAIDYVRRTFGVFKPELKQVKPGKLLELSEGYYRIVLDEKGIELDSVQVSEKLQAFIDRAYSVAFLIGPPEGHAPEIHEKANAIWSLSRMTFPHKLALCMLAEQIYRAGEIARRGPYHK